MSKIKSLELPEEVEYKLTKVKSLNGHQPYIRVKQTATGDLFTNPITIGSGVIVGRGISQSIYTTPVQKIKLTKNSTKVIIHTENSIYKLEEYEDPDTK